MARIARDVTGSNAVVMKEPTGDGLEDICVSEITIYPLIALALRGIYIT